MLRGDGITPPETAPNHLVTVNGVFPMTDPYFAEISATATLEGKQPRDTTTVSNIINYNPSSAEKMRKFKALIEAKIAPMKMPDLKELLLPKEQINLAQMLATATANAFDFDFNSSLVPGFSPKDLNAVEYNYVRVDGKTKKIPVERSERVANKFIGEELIVINDLIIESLTNNFVLKTLLDNRLITQPESNFLYNGMGMLLESEEAAHINLKTVYENVISRLEEEPLLLNKVINILNSVSEEYKRDYKMEYRNYHGKPKQRRERAKRTKAREQMIKKGKVKKGDGKDIDHKKPLRHGGSNGINNWRIRDKSENRSDNGHRKGEKQNKDWK
jgi:hypothetical protein